MDGTPGLVERWQAFAASTARNNAARNAAGALAGTDPDAALPAIDAVLPELDAMEATHLGLIADTPGHPETPAQCRAEYLDRRLALLQSRFVAARFLGRAAETLRTASLARALLAGRADHPFLAVVEEEEAAIATDPAVAEQKRDSAFQRRVAAGDALGAARNRMIEATLAATDGRIDRARACADAAVGLAQAHDLRREMVTFRMQRYSLLLVADQAGRARDALRAELDFTARPRGALADALERIYAEGLAALDGPDAAVTARAFGLPAEAQAPALAAQRDSQRVTLLLLAAQFKAALGDQDTPIEDILPQADALARSPEERCRVASAFADAREAVGDQAGALEDAARAAEAAQGSLSTVLRAQAEARLNALRATAGPMDALDAEDQAARRMPEVFQALGEGRFADALAIAAALIALGPDGAVAGQVRVAEGVALLELHRDAEAAASLAEAATVFAAVVAADVDGEGDGPAQWEAALLLRAFVLARSGQAVPAWEAAESARSRLLRRALRMPDAAWPEVRDALRGRGAALMTVTVMRWGTLVFSALPGEAEPRASVYDGFRSADLVRLLGQAAHDGLTDDSEAWTQVIMDAAPGLTAGLMPALRDRLLAMRAASVLYLIPDDTLFYAPLAAMEVSPGQPLGAVMPISLLPFAGLLTAPSAPAVDRRVLLMAAGQDTQGYDFNGHLDLLAPVTGAGPGDLRTGAAASPAGLVAGASYGTLYVSSHGLLDHAVADVMRASSLVLAGGARLSAAALAGAELGAGLVFLNACQSGRFRAQTRTELGGFPAAVLRAGRTALIAPLTHVDPHAAGRLAAGFFAARAAGQRPAAALLAARTAAIATGAPPADWAAHTMFGTDE